VEVGKELHLVLGRGKAPQEASAWGGDRHLRAEQVAQPFPGAAREPPADGGDQLADVAVGKGEVLGVAVDEGHLQPFGLCAPPGPLHQFGIVDTPTARQKRRAAARAALPLPQAAASTRSPACRSTDSQSSSFSAAAEALAFTQPAVSQQVAALERETGTRLVERGVRPVRLTDAGHALVAHAERCSPAWTRLSRSSGRSPGCGGAAATGQLPSANATLVPAAIASFNQRHPDVDVTVADDHQQGLLARLGRWELDLALIYEHDALPQPEERLERISLLDDPFDLVVPGGHPLARRTSVALVELAEETWIGGTPDGAYARIVLHSCRIAGFEPRVIFGSDDYNAVQAFVAVGLGVAILPHLALTFPRPDLARVALTAPPVRRITAARLAASFRFAATASMLDVLEETTDAFIRLVPPGRGAG
jgi:DNA-binding transcriptional LysR family regulator